MAKRKTKTILQNFARFIKLKVVHADDSAHRIALGLAIGVFVSWTPTVGFHVLLTLAFAFLLRANKALAVIGTIIGNPLTFFPIYYSSYIIGKYVLSLFNYSANKTNPDFRESFAKFDIIANMARIHTSAFWKELFDALWHIGLELWIGGIIAGFLAAAITYFAAVYIVTNHRKNKPRRRFLKHFHKSQAS